MLRVEDEKVTFSVFEAMKHPSDRSPRYEIESVGYLVSK
jgi:hypothetical protein